MNVDNPHDRFFKETVVRLDILTDSLKEEGLSPMFNEKNLSSLAQDAVRRVDVTAIFCRISNRTGEIAMSTAERLINEGLEKGLERGLEKGVCALGHRRDCRSGTRSVTSPS